MAGTSLEAVRSNMTDSIGKMTSAQRAGLGAAFVAIVLALYVVSRVAGQTPMQTLFADLEPSAASAIVDELDARAVPYELADNGRVVKVPVNQVHTLRIQLSSQGLPDLGSGGWSILDNQGITTSEFDQRVGFQRALEGELERTISVIEGIDKANVHLVIPDDDLFVGDDIAASASVLLQTQGRTISNSQVQAIVNLVAASVEGMTAERVSITDEAGRILAAPGDAPSGGMEGESQLMAASAYESGLERDIQELIAAVVGPGRSVVTVTADLNFDAVSTITEEFIPSENADGEQTVVAETTRAETYQTADAEGTTGVLGVEATETVADIVASEDLRYNLDERDATYAMNKVVTSADQAPGEVETISVAVLLDESTVEAAELDQISDLVTAAAGLDVERGDTIAVTALAFDESIVASLEAEAAAAAEAAEAGGSLDIMGLARVGATALIGIVVLMLGLRKVSKGSRREVLEAIDLEALPAGTAGSLGTGEEDTEAERERKATADEEMAALLSNQPVEVANVLRTWLTESAEVSA